MKFEPFFKHPYRWKQLTFRHPFDKHGNPRIYTSILLYLHENGPASKKEILINALGRTGPTYLHFPLSTPGNFNDEGCRGYLSSMFADMHYAGLITYDKSTQKWSIGPRYEDWKYWLRYGETPPKLVYNPD